MTPGLCKYSPVGAQPREIISNCATETEIIISNGSLTIEDLLCWGRRRESEGWTPVIGWGTNRMFKDWLFNGHAARKKYRTHKIYRHCKTF